MLTSLDHVIVAVRDLPRAARVLAGLLGRAPSWRGSHPSLGTENVLFRLSNTCLELLAPRPGPGVPAESLRRQMEAQGEGLAGIAFGTPNADACAAELRSRGLRASDPVDGLGRDDESGAFRQWRTVGLPREATRGVWLFAIEQRSPADLLVPAAPLGAPEACAAGVDHVVLHSPDLEAARRLYGEGLGLRLALDRQFEARGLRILFFRVGGVTLEIVGRLQSPADAGATDRLGGLALQVPEAAAARERASAAGFDVSPVRDGFKPGTRVCSVRGKPLGVDVLLIQPATGGAAALR